MLASCFLSSNCSQVTFSSFNRQYVANRTCLQGTYREELEADEQPIASKRSSILVFPCFYCRQVGFPHKHCFRVSASETVLSSKYQNLNSIPSYPVSSYHSVANTQVSCCLAHFLCHAVSSLSWWMVLLACHCCYRYGSVIHTTHNSI